MVRELQRLAFWCLAEFLGDPPRACGRQEFSPPPRHGVFRGTDGPVCLATPWRTSGCVRRLALSSKADMDLLIQVFVWTCFSFSGMPEGAVAGLCGNSVIVFPEWLYHVNCHQQYMNNLVSSRPPQHLLFLVWFYFRHFGSRMGTSHCSFNWHFPGS